MELIEEAPNSLTIKYGDKISILRFFVPLLGVMFIISSLTQPDLRTPTQFWIDFLFGCALLLGGGYYFLTKYETFITFDKRSNKVFVLDKSFIKENIEGFSINKVKKVELNQSYTVSRIKGRIWTRLIATVVLVLDDGNFTVGGRKLSYHETNNIATGFTALKEKVVGEKIARFLNIPFNEIKSSP